MQSRWERSASVKDVCPRIRRNEIREHGQLENSRLPRRRSRASSPLLFDRGEDWGEESRSLVKPHTVLPRIVAASRVIGRYCLSYAAFSLDFLPCSSEPCAVTMRDLPSAATTMRPVMVVLPSFFTVNANVWSSTFL